MLSDRVVGPELVLTHLFWFALYRSKRPRSSSRVSETDVVDEDDMPLFTKAASR